MATNVTPFNACIDHNAHYAHTHTHNDIYDMGGGFLPTLECVRACALVGWLVAPGPCGGDPARTRV